MTDRENLTKERALNSRWIQGLLFAFGLGIGLAWSFPLDPLGALFITLSYLTLCFVSERGGLAVRPGPYRTILLAGMLAHTFGFYWIFGTIRQFGEFPAIGAALVFLLFITLSSLQFPLFLFVYSNLPKALDRVALRIPIAWISVEILAIRIFPWSAAHPLSSYPALIQIAELGGIHAVSFVFLFLCSALARAVVTKNILLGSCALLATFMIQFWGQERIADISSNITGAKQIPVTLVQGNVRLSEKHDRSLVLANMRKYYQLSLDADRPGNLIVWPETVLMDWLPEDVGHAASDRRLPHFERGASLLFGSLSYRSESELYNSAFAIGPKGDVPLPYHKRILMPFGEFTPFADTFPFLRTLNNTAGDFSEGSGIPIVSMPILLDQQLSELKVTPLICYEDVLPQIATEGTKNGSELLVNITNDAWFGESIAPLQHHQIALFRAVENRRFLLRATNTGLTAIVSATGQTIAQAPLFKEATLNGTISPLTSTTFFAQYEIQHYWQLFSVLSSSLSILCFLTIKRREV